MDKKQAHAILDRIRSGESNMPLSFTIEALQTLGDMGRLSIDETVPSPALRADGYESSDHRSFAVYGSGTVEVVGWSRYLDCKPH